MSDRTDREKYLIILDRFYRGRGGSLLTKDESEALKYAISSIKTDLKYDLLYEGEDELCNGDCDNCDFVDGDYCRFNEKQQEIYMPPRLEPDNCGNYVVQDSTTKNDLGLGAVSRQAVLELIADNDLSMGQVVRGIHALPPVTLQEPRKGKWIPVFQGDEIIDYRCSCCEFGNTFGKGTVGMNYCPRCGSRNEVEE